MVQVNTLGTVRIGWPDVQTAEDTGAGCWLFSTGHEAIDFETGSAFEVTCPLGFACHGMPRYRRKHASQRPDLLDNVPFIAQNAKFRLTFEQDRSLADIEKGVK